MSGIRNHARAKIKSDIKAAVDSEPGDIPWPRILSIAAILFIITGIGYYNGWLFHLRTAEDKNEQRVADASHQTKEEEPAIGEHIAGNDRPPETTRGDHGTRTREKAKGESSRPATERSMQARSDAVRTVVWLTGDIDIVPPAYGLRKSLKQSFPDEANQDSDMSLGSEPGTGSGTLPDVFNLAGEEIRVITEVDSSLQEGGLPQVRGFLMRDSTGISLTILVPASLGEKHPVSVNRFAGKDSLFVYFEGLTIRFPWHD